MIQFTALYRDKLQWKKIKDTKSEWISQRPANMFACFNFLADVLTGDGRNPTEQMAEMFADRLEAFYPGMKWATLNVLHEQLMAGKVELKLLTVGAIMRRLAFLQDGAGLDPDDKMDLVYPETTQHALDYVERFGNSDRLHEKMSLQDFLEMHKPGTFATLETMKNGPMEEMASKMRKNDF